MKGMMLLDMAVRDLPEVVNIEKASFSKPWSETLFYNEIRNERSIAKIARLDGKIAGYICASVVVDEAHILTLAVDPALRKEGIATALVRHVIERARERGCRAVFLEVRASNGIARRMYERFNFVALGTRKNYYGEPSEDAVVMVLRFDDIAEGA